MSPLMQAAADAFFTRWNSRVRAFLWVALRATATGTGPCDHAVLRDREARMIASMREDHWLELAAAAARRLDDEAMAQALAVSHEGGDGASMTEGGPSGSGERDSKGWKRARETSVPVSMRAFAAEVGSEETTLTVRVLLRKEVSSKGLQTD